MKKILKIVLLSFCLTFSSCARAGFFGWLDLVALIVVLRTAERILLEKQLCCSCCKGAGMKSLAPKKMEQKQACQRKCLEGQSAMVVLLKGYEYLQKKEE